MISPATQHRHSLAVLAENINRSVSSLSLFQQQMKYMSAMIGQPKLVDAFCGAGSFRATPSGTKGSQQFVDQMTRKAVTFNFDSTIRSMTSIAKPKAILGHILAGNPTIDAATRAKEIVSRYSESVRPVIRAKPRTVNHSTDDIASVRSQLESIEPTLLKMFDGAWMTLYSGNPDTDRHLSASTRELLIFFLDDLAPAHIFEVPKDQTPPLKKVPNLRQRQLAYIQQKFMIDTTAVERQHLRTIKWLLRKFNDAIHSKRGSDYLGDPRIVLEHAHKSIALLVEIYKKSRN